MKHKIGLIYVIIVLIISCNGRISNKAKTGDIYFIGNLFNRTYNAVSGIKERDHYLYPEIYSDSKMIFKDTSTTFYNLNSKENQLVEVKNLLNQFYILLDTSDPPEADKWVILKINDNKVVSYQKAIKQLLMDLDNDGFLEVGGFDVIDAYCLDCDSAYYNPAQIYKLGNEFKFDEVSSEIVTKQIYGVYLGNERKDTVLKVYKK